MCLDHGARMLAAAATNAAVAAPAAHASPIGNGGGLNGLPLLNITTSRLQARPARPTGN